MNKIPNQLTMSRIVIVILMALIYWLADIFSWEVRWLLLALFALGSFTDFLDGYLARKYQVISDFGKLMDPIADKMLVNTTFFLLALNREIAYPVFILMLWRDFFVDGLRMFFASKGQVLAAGVFGKIKTVLQMVAIIFVFLRVPYHQVVVGLALLSSLYSGVEYGLNAYKNIRKMAK